MDARLRILTCAVTVAALTAGCSSKPPPPTATASSEPAAATHPPPPPRPEFSSARCRVYTSEPGFTVFVDGNRIVDAQGAPVVTPCAVTAAPGSHTVSVVRAGRPDLSQQVLFAEDSEVVFDTSAASATGESALLSAPYLDTAPGTPIPLHALNTPGRESDPYVSPDGRAVWFVSDRPAGRGVYVATRAGPLDEFSEPRLLEMTRGADLPASPSLTADGESVVYVTPEKARVWALTRSNPLAEFDERTPLFFAAADGEQWLSAQITGDGLRLYFVRESGGKRETRVVIREREEDKFGTNVLVVNLPGEHPCLSSDGLRQFAFDGRTLSRARRETIATAFTAPETIAELSLDTYGHSPRHRQFWVTDDEQWLFYCDDPSAGGDLYLVRLSSGPAWGVALLGEPIEPRAVAMVDTASVPDKSVPDADTPETVEKPVDPRTLHLPYAQFRERFVALLAERKFDEADAAIAGARGQPDLAAGGELLDWDAEDVQSLRAIWQEVERAAAQLKPGDEFRLGPAKLEFVRYADGVLVGKTRTRETERPLAKFDAPSLAELVERVAGDDPATKLRLATLFAYDPDANSAARQRRFADAGEAGAQLAERLAMRLVRLAEWELARDNSDPALQLIDRVATEYPGTPAAQAAATLRERVYTSFAWQRRGNRQWETGPEGEYAAGAGRAEGSVLLSPREYARFDLSMEYRTTGPTGQGGVFFRYRGTGPLYNRCFKIQLSNDQGVNPDPYCTGALFSLQAPRVNATRPAGEWNSFRMKVDGEQVKVWINDQLVLETEAIDDQIPEAGYVALDGIAGGIAYRRVVVRGESSP